MFSTSPLPYWAIMGSMLSCCKKSGHDIMEEDAPKQYSWDKREKIDPKDFTIEDQKDITAGRMPGTINGQQFIIRNCENTNIYLFDHIATLTIDNCTGCRIFVGPIKTSIFVRDCEDCKIMATCQQYRTRDCKKIDSLLCCVTMPIIEASTGMKFGCFQYSYPQLESQFRSAGVSPFNNKWSMIHDFTPVPGENNYSLLPEDIQIDELIPQPVAEPYSNLEVKTSVADSVVPITHGLRRKPSNESCLVVFFHTNNSQEKAKLFIKIMRECHSGCVLIQSKEIAMQANDAQRVFGNDEYSMAVHQGEVIALEYNSDNICQICQDVRQQVDQAMPGMMFVSANAAVAGPQVDNFYNFADMHMNC